MSIQKKIENHIIETDDTIRETAKEFGLSKGKVHREIKKSNNPKLREIMERHKDEFGDRGAKAYKRMIDKVGKVEAEYEEYDLEIFEGSESLMLKVYKDGELYEYRPVSNKEIIKRMLK